MRAKLMLAAAGAAVVLSASVAEATPTLCGFQVCYNETPVAGVNVQGQTGVQGSGPHVYVGTSTTVTAAGLTAKTGDGVSNSPSASECQSVRTADGQTGVYSFGIVSAASLFPWGVVVGRVAVAGTGVGAGAAEFVPGVPVAGGGPISGGPPSC